MDTLMDTKQTEEFLKASKDEYHDRPEQKQLQERDAKEVGPRKKGRRGSVPAGG